MSNFDETLMKRLTKLEREVERLKVKERPVGGGGGVTDHGALTGLADNDHPQYRLVADAIDHGALGGLADNDHPQYLLTTGKATDSDKLDGVDSTGFATAGHNHSGVYLPIAGKAADSDKLDNIDSTGFVQTSGNQTVAGIKTFSSIPVLPASNPTTANQAVRKGYADALVPSSATLYTATLVGWSGTPNQSMKYVRIGKLMILTIYISGTSNSTTATATLPSGITAMALGYSQYAPVRVMNAGSMPSSWGMAALSSGGSTISFYVNQGSGGWTNSGTKTIEGTFVFLTA